jgi:hypothetical protein
MSEAKFAVNLSARPKSSRIPSASPIVKGPPVPRDTERSPQCSYAMHHRRACSVSQRDRKEIRASRNKIAPVSDHLQTLSRILLRSIRAARYTAPMVKTLEQAIAEVEPLPAEDREQIGRTLLSHVEKLRALRAEID